MIIIQQCRAKKSVDGHESVAKIHSALHGVSILILNSTRTTLVNMSTARAVAQDDSQHPS